MSTTQIRPVYDLGVAADYLEHGLGSKKKGHLAQGTNRVAPGSYVDAASIEQFIAWGNQLAATHHRRVKAHSIIVAFHPDELDVTNPADLQRGGDLAYLVAKEAFPNSPAMVIVHDDADGGHVHAHVTVLNHDLQTGRAPTKNRNHAAIRKINDRVMVEQGMSTATPYAGQRTSWADRRMELADDPFAVKVGDLVADAKGAALAGDLDRFDEVFDAECAARGVTVHRSTHKVETDARRGRRKGDDLVGVTFSAMADPEPGYRSRRRRRKASKLAGEFTAAGLERAVEAERQRRAAEARKKAAIQLQQQAALAAQQPAQERDDPTMSRMRRVMEGLPPESDQAAPATAGALPSDGATAPTSDQTHDHLDHVTDTSPVATAPGGHSDGAIAPTSYVSAVRRLRADGAKAQATLDAWAEFDEDAWARLQAGQRLVEDRGPDQKGAKGVGAKLLASKIGQAFHPEVRAELERRIALLAEAREDLESGRIDDARQKRSLVRRGIYEVPAGPTARERLVVEMATEVPDAPEHDEDERQL